jgi:hypothetical protein
MQTVECLFGIFYARPRAMDNGLAAFKNLGEFIGFIGIERDKSRAFDGLVITRILSASDDDDFMSTLNQISRDMPSNKTGPTGNCNFHKSSSHQVVERPARF